MAAKKSSGRFSKGIAVIFTSLVAPIIVNVTAVSLRSEGTRGEAAAPSSPPAYLAAPQSVPHVTAKQSDNRLVIATSRPKPIWQKSSNLQNGGQSPAN